MYAGTKGADLHERKPADYRPVHAGSQEELPATGVQFSNPSVTTPSDIQDRSNRSGGGIGGVPKIKTPLHSESSAPNLHRVLTPQVRIKTGEDGNLLIIIGFRNLLKVVGILGIFLDLAVEPEVQLPKDTSRPHRMPSVRVILVPAE